MSTDRTSIDQTTNLNNDSTSSETLLTWAVIILVAILSVVLLFTCIVIVIVYYRRKNQNRTEKSDEGFQRHSKRLRTITRPTESVEKNNTPPMWMLFVFSIDGELPTVIKWTCPNGEVIQIPENVYNQLKNRNDPNDLHLKYNGIFQCERALGIKKDNINVVLSSSYPQKDKTLIVDPSFWKSKNVKILNSKSLKTIIDNIEDKCEADPKQYFTVSWAYRKNHRHSYKTFEGATKCAFTISQYVPADITGGEFRCIVQWPPEKQKQIYYFIVKSLMTYFNEEEEEGKVETNQIIRGVPNLLIRNEKIKYYAYGSNQLESRMLINNPSAKCIVKAAKLKDYKLAFISMDDPKSSKWHGGVATIEYAYQSHVWGQIYELDVDQVPNLNRQEGFYKAIHVNVVTDKGQEYTDCRTYLLERDSKRQIYDDRPSAPYMSLIVRGAHEHGIEESYIKELQAIQVNDYLDVPTRFNQS